MTTSLVIIVFFTLAVWYISQTKFQKKILCEFYRPNNTIIEKFVPIDSTYVIFKIDKDHVGRYEINSECIVMHWYKRGINTLFPVLIPKLIFSYDTPNAWNFRTHERTWKTPEAMQAGWEEHNHIAFAKANAMVSGMKKSLFDVIVPILTILVLLIVGYLVWSGDNSINKNFQTMQQQFNQIPGYVPK